MKFRQYEINNFFIFGPRLQDTASQYMNERMRNCEANVGDEKVQLQLISRPGDDLNILLHQLTILLVGTLNY